MSFEIPQQAEEYFNREAKEILLLLEHHRSSNERLERDVESSASHLFLANPITESDVINLSSLGSVDQLGEKKSRYFHTEQGWFGFSEENYSRVLKLTNGLSRRKELRDILSENFLINAFFKWVENRYKNQIPISQDFINYLRQDADNEIKERKISIPIPFLIIEESFRIGKITFEYYTKEFFDNIENHVREHADKITPQIEEGLRRFRKNYQGKVFASMSLRAERNKCIEIAKNETDKSLTILRFFSPSALLPEVPSYFGRMGQVDVPSNHVFIFENSFPIVHTGRDEKADPDWRITRGDISRFENYGLQNANEILNKERLTKFEELLFNSLSLYAKGITSKDIHDKLVFTLVSIETLLLKNESEPIQSSIGFRLAFLSGSTVENRKKIIKLVKDCYQQRSRFIHHGRQEGDLHLLRNLQICVWTALKNLLKSKDNFPSQEQLIELIEDRILSG